MLTLRAAYWACLLLFFPLSVYAQNINPTASTRSTISTSGTYSFTWNAGKIRGISPYYVWLYEGSNPIRLSYPSQGSTLKHQGEYTFRNRTKGSRTYYIKACMTNDSRDCRYSSRTTVTVRAKPTPTKVSGLHLTGGDGRVDLSWRAQSNISRYDIRYSLPRVYGGSVVVTTNRGTVKNLSDGQWVFDVRACNTDNVCGPWSDKQSKNIVKKPGVPTSFSSNESTSYDGGYTLSWGSSANTVTRYEWREKKNAGNWSGFNSTGTGRSVGRANSNGTYYYQVRACNAGGCSGVRSLTVKVDKNISPVANRSTSTSSTGGYSISWNAGRYLGKVPQYVWLYEGSKAIRLSYPSQGSTIKSSGTYQLRHTSQGTRNYYLRTCLTASSQCVNSRTTSVKVDFPAPPKVGTVTLGNSEGSYDTNGRIDTSWAGVSHAKRYEIHYGLKGKSKTTVSSNSASRSFSGLADGLWEFQVRGCNQANECGTWSNLRAKQVLRLPGVPSSFGSNESPSYDGAYTLSWGTSANSVARYEWREQVNGGGWSGFSSTGTGRALNRVKNNGTYGYHVRACNAAGCSGVRSVTVKVDKNIAPVVSRSTSTSSTGGYSISWNAGRYLGKVPQYVWLYEDSKAIRLSYPSQGSSIKSSGTYHASHTSQGTRKYYLRTCHNTNSQCVNSSTTSVKVDFPAPPKVGTVTLGNSEGSYDTNGRIDTSWAGVSHAKRYEIQYGLKGKSKTTVSSNTASRSFTGLADGVWEFQVRACNQANECGTWSNLSAKHVLRVPGVPSSFTSNESPSYDGSYTLSWGTATNSVAYYGWREKVNAGGWSGFTRTGTSRTLNRVKNNGTYSYHVHACNAAGCSGVASLSVKVMIPPTPSPEPSPYASPFVWLDRYSSSGKVDVRLNPSNRSVAEYGSWEYQYLATHAQSPNWNDPKVKSVIVARQTDQVIHQVQLATPAPSASNIRFRYAFRAREFAPARSDNQGPCNDPITYPSGPCHTPWGAGDSILVGPTPTPLPTPTPYPLSLTDSLPSPSPTALPVITSQSSASITSAAMANYTLYYGDFNSDGRFNDIYFVGAGSLRDFVYYQNSDGSHRDAVVLPTSNNTLTNATLLTLNQDYFIHHFDSDGIPDFLIRGKTVHDVTMMLRPMPYRKLWWTSLATMNLITT